MWVQQDRENTQTRINAWIVIRVDELATIMANISEKTNRIFVTIP